jgi:hypothetical protein
VSSRLPRSNEHRLILGDYTADIVISKRYEHLCYYVIQRMGSADIIEIQPFDNPGQAETAANVALKTWGRQDVFRRSAS